METDKKRTAAIAGVMAYLSAQQEQSCAQPAPAPSAWALNGRQTIMQNRTMIQRGIGRHAKR